MTIMRRIRNALGYSTVSAAPRGTGSTGLRTASAQVSSEAQQLQQNLRRMRLDHEYPLVELASRIAGEPVDIVRREGKERQ